MNQHNLESRFLFFQRNYNVDPAANLQIFGFRGYVCDKCLTPETYYVAFPNAEGQGRIETVLCDPAKAAATSKLVDRFGVFSSLYDKIPTLIKQEVNSRAGNNISLVALRSTKSSFVVFIVKSAPDGYTHPVG